MPTFSSLLSGPVLASLSRVWIQAVGLALLLAATAVISPVEFGGFAIASAVVNILAIFVGHGHYEYILKGDDRDAAPSTILVVNMACAAGLIVLMVLLAAPLARLVETDQVEALLLWLAPVLLLHAVSAVTEPVLLRHQRLRHVALATIGAETLALAAGLVALFSGLGAFALVAHKWCREAAHSALLLVAHHWQPKLTFDPATARRSIRFALGIVWSRLGSNLTNYGSELTIGVVLSPAAAGLFRLANRIISSVAEIVSYALRMLLWVRLPAVRNNDDAFARELVTGLEVAGVAYFALITGAASMSWLVFPLFFAPEWHDGLTAMTILAVARLVILPSLIVEPILVMRDRTDWLFVYNASFSVVGLSLLVLFGRLGLEAASLSQLVASVVFMCVAAWIVDRFKILTPLLIAKLLIALSISALVMAAAVGAIALLTHSLGTNEIIGVIAAALFGAVAYGLMVLTTLPQPAASVRSALRGSAARP